MDRLDIQSDGTVHGTKVLADGVEIKNVTALSINIESNGVIQADMTLFAIPVSVSFPGSRLQVGHTIGETGYTMVRTKDGGLELYGPDGLVWQK